MPEKHRRYFLKDKEAKELLAKASERLKVDLGRIFKAKAGFEVVETDFGEVFLADGKPWLVKIGEDVFPALIFNEFLTTVPKVVVDMGAVPYVCKGANIMAPGVMRYEGEFRKGDLVLVVDERHGKALSVAETLIDSDVAKNAKQGAVAKNIHFVGDRVWNFMKGLTTKP